jgi:phosphatidylglycerophosphate synthase
LAGITDFLDGFLARKLNKISPLGIALDPLVDKIMAVILIIELIYFRNFPIWLAAAIIGRDVLFVIIGSIVMKGKNITLPSIITGKYYFSAIVVLIASYIMKFEFGISIFIPITIALLVLSTWFYARRFYGIIKNRELKKYDSSINWRTIRVGLTLIISVIYLFKLYVNIIRPGLRL